MQDKRKISRAPFSAEAVVKHENAVFHCKLIDFSLTGFLLSDGSNGELDVGQHVNLEIASFQRNGSFCEIVCEIVRKEDAMLGVKCLAMAYDTFLILEAQLAKMITEDKLFQEVESILNQ
jgi:c-di-GMP-binding flagellar brake protein YcgR